MKVAHLILAHKNPAQVERLIRALDHPSFDFFLHIDQKSELQPFLYLGERKNVKFIRNRTRIYWASFGTIQATINGFEEILPLNDHDYINVISAQDFPIKSPQQIHDFLEANKGKEFITCESVHDEWPEAAVRVEKYYLVNYQLPGRFKLEKLMNRILPKRKFPFDFDIVGRANWFTLSPEAARYALDFMKKNPQIVRFFKFSWGADELIWSTILYNSPFKNKIERNLVYVDWTGQTQGHPRILVASDFDRLKQSDRLFARKFDTEKDAAILDLLEEHIGTKKQETVSNPSAL